MYKSFLTFLLALFITFPLAHATSLDDSARERGITTCREMIARESAIAFGTNPHRSHDFVSKDSRNVDKRPFFSMGFKKYEDVGTAHVTVSAARADLSRRTRKCDIHVTEHFFSEMPCEEWSMDLANQKFMAVPLSEDVTVLERDEGSPNPFSFYYLTRAQNGNSCFVARRRISFEE